MGSDLFFIEVLELIQDIDFEPSWPFLNDPEHYRKFKKVMGIE